MMITIGLLVKSSLESYLWLTVLLIIAMIPKRPLKSSLESQPRFIILLIIAMIPKGLIKSSLES